MTIVHYVGRCVVDLFGSRQSGLGGDGRLVHRFGPFQRLRRGRPYAVHSAQPKTSRRRALVRGHQLAVQSTQRYNKRSEFELSELRGCPNMLKDTSPQRKEINAMCHIGESKISPNDFNADVRFIKCKCYRVNAK